jgi:hypothetical protein
VVDSLLNSTAIDLMLIFIFVVLPILVIVHWAKEEGGLVELSIVKWIRLHADFRSRKSK